MNDFFDQHFVIIPVGFPQKAGSTVTAQDIFDVFTETTGPRPIWRIAQDIDATWVDKNGKPNVNYAAVPYLEALRDLDKITDMYGCDSAKYIITYFIGNAAAFKGEAATALKNELRAIAGLPIPKTSKKKG